MQEWRPSQQRARFPKRPASTRYKNARKARWQTTAGAQAPQACAISEEANPLFLPEPLFRQSLAGKGWTEGSRWRSPADESIQEANPTDENWQCNNIPNKPITVVQDNYSWSNFHRESDAVCMGNRQSQENDNLTIQSDYEDPDFFLRINYH